MWLWSGASGLCFYFPSCSRNCELCVFYLFPKTNFLPQIPYNPNTRSFCHSLERGVLLTLTQVTTQLLEQKWWRNFWVKFLCFCTSIIVSFRLHFRETWLECFPHFSETVTECRAQWGFFQVLASPKNWTRHRKAVDVYISWRLKRRTIWDVRSSQWPEDKKKGSFVSKILGLSLLYADKALQKPSYLIFTWHHALYKLSYEITHLVSAYMSVRYQS